MSWYAWLPLVLCTVPLESRVIFILSWRAECSNPRFPAQGCNDLGKKGRNLEDWSSLVSFVYRESSTLNFYRNSIHWGMALLFVFESNPAGSGKSPSRLTEPQLLRGNFQPGVSPGSPLFTLELWHSYFWVLLVCPKKELWGPSFSSGSGTHISEGLGAGPRDRSVLCEGDMWGLMASFNLDPSALYRQEIH